MSGLIFIDVEASGLHRTSFPIEVGWVDTDLRVTSHLIRPEPGWTLDDWSSESEKVHGITWDDLVIKGIAARDVALMINESCGGARVFSDAPGYEARWLGRLFADTNVKPANTMIEHIEALIREDGECDLGEEELDALIDRVDRKYPHPHRAGPDALRMAARWKAIRDRAWREAEFGATFR